MESKLTRWLVPRGVMQKEEKRRLHDQRSNSELNQASTTLQKFQDSVMWQQYNNDVISQTQKMRYSTGQMNEFLLPASGRGLNLVTKSSV